MFCVLIEKNEACIFRFYRTPLLCAIEWDNQRVANFLLQEKAIDTNVKDENGRCALSVALLDKKDVILAESLIHSGAHVDATLSNGIYFCLDNLHECDLLRSYEGFVLAETFVVIPSKVLMKPLLNSIENVSVSFLNDL